MLDTAKKFSIESVVKVPINPNIARLSDGGKIELIEGEFLDELKELVQKA